MIPGHKLIFAIGIEDKTPPLIASQLHKFGFKINENDIIRFMKDGISGDIEYYLAYILDLKKYFPKDWTPNNLIERRMSYYDRLISHIIILNEIIDAYGGHDELAKILDVTPKTIMNWENKAHLHNCLLPERYHEKVIDNIPLFYSLAKLKDRLKVLRDGY